METELEDVKVAITLLRTELAAAQNRETALVLEVVLAYGQNRNLRRVWSKAHMTLAGLRAR